MHHLRAIKTKLENTLEIINANLGIYNQRVKEIRENPGIKPEHKQMNINKFESHFVSVVGMSVADIEAGRAKIEELIRTTQEKILIKKTVDTAEREKSKIEVG